MELDHSHVKMVVRDGQMRYAALTAIVRSSSQTEELEMFCQQGNVVEVITFQMSVDKMKLIPFYQKNASIAN